MLNKNIIDKFIKLTYFFISISCAHQSFDVKDNTDSIDPTTQNIEANKMNDLAESTGICTYFKCENETTYICKFVSGKLLKENSQISTKSYKNFVEEFCYLDDINNKNGKYVSWFPNGSIESSGYYEHGRKTGEWSFWYKDGNLEGKGQFKDNRMNGEWNFFYKNGNKMFNSIIFDNGDTKNYVSIIDLNGNESDKYKIKGNVAYDIYNMEKLKNSGNNGPGNINVYETKIYVIPFLIEHNDTVSDFQKWGF